MALTLAINIRQQRLMNVVYGLQNVRADRAMQAANVDAAEIYQLQGARLILAYDLRGHGADLLAMPTSALLCVFLQPTPLGVDWVTGDPMNVLLKALDIAPQRQMTLCDATRDADEQTVRDAVDQGFASLHYAGDLRRAKFDTGDGRYEFRHARDFVIQATPKIRRALGPR